MLPEKLIFQAFSGVSFSTHFPFRRLLRDSLVSSSFRLFTRLLLFYILFSSWSVTLVPKPGRLIVCGAEYLLGTLDGSLVYVFLEDPFSCFV